MPVIGQRHAHIKAGVGAAETVGAQFAFKAPGGSSQQLPAGLQHPGVIRPQAARRAQLVEGALPRRAEQVAATLRGGGFFQQRRHLLLAFGRGLRRIQLRLANACSLHAFGQTPHLGVHRSQLPGHGQRRIGIGETEVGGQAHRPARMRYTGLDQPVSRLFVGGIHLQQGAVTLRGLFQVPRLQIRRRAGQGGIALLGQPCAGVGQVNMAGIELRGRADHCRSFGQRTAAQRCPGLLQQLGHRIVAAAKGLQVFGIQAQDPAVERQGRIRLRVQPPLFVGTGGACPQLVQPGAFRLARAQGIGHLLHVSARGGQRPRQVQRPVRLRVVAGGGFATGLFQRRVGHRRQSLARLRAVRIHGQGGFVQFARTAAIGVTEMALGQRSIGLAQRLLGGVARPQQFGQRLAQHQQRHQQQGHGRCNPAPM